MKKHEENPAKIACFPADIQGHKLPNIGYVKCIITELN